MADQLPQAGTIEPELLVATCSSSGRILFRNGAWKILFGDGDELWSRLVSGDEKIAAQNFKEAIGGSLVTHALFMVDRLDRDAPYPVLLHFIPTMVTAEDSDEVHRVVTLTGEVLAEPVSWTESQTDRHRMETLGRMTMGIAHDFNNLLSGILGHVAIMRAEHDILDEENPIFEHIQTIEQAANDGAALINKIQRYIRQEKQTAFEMLDLKGLIEDCVVLTKPYWYNEPRCQGISIDLDYKSDKIDPILGSAAGLRDVFVNLILNAVQAMPKGGHITIRSAQSESRIRVQVTDTGTGMTDSVRNRIFEPLFTTKGERGTGMGLSVVFGAIREHGGTIDVASEPGLGTTFTLTFPTADAPETEAVSDVSLPEDRKVRVLVVDDEDMVLRVVDRLLTLRGHTVISVSSAIAALNELEHREFDIIISDQGMPEMSGRELAHKVRGRYPSLPVVLLTGDTDLEVNENEIARVISKPFKVGDLDLAIRDLACVQSD